MTNNFGLSDQTIALLYSAFKKFPRIKEVKIFGSRAMGNYHPGSDIDLAAFPGNFSHSELLDLLSALEDLQLLYEIDCLDYHEIDNAALKEHIDLVGQTFYKKHR